MIDLQGVRKLSAGVTQQMLSWRPPVGYAVDPVLVMRGTTVPLASVAGDVNGTEVTDVNGTLLTLASDIHTSLQGQSGDLAGDAWFDAGEQGQFLVRIRRVYADGLVSIAELAEPLPREVVIDDGDYALHWLAWVAPEVPSDVVDLGSEKRVEATWTVTYTATAGTTMQTQTIVDEGLVVICRQPFRTACTSLNLLSLVPMLRSQIPPGQESFAEQVAAAFEELVLMTRAKAPANRWEDDIAGHPFTPVHAHLAAAVVLEGQADGGYGAEEAAKRHRERAQAMFDLLMGRNPWIDADQDGVIEAGETGVATIGISGAGRWRKARHSNLVHEWERR